jgi:hypothetical protein
MPVIRRSLYVPVSLSLSREKATELYVLSKEWTFFYNKFCFSYSVIILIFKAALSGCYSVSANTSRVLITQHCFIQHALSECSILSTVNSMCSRMNQTPPPHTFYILCNQLQLLHTYNSLCTGMTLPQRNGRRHRSKYPLLISWKNKHFHLQIYIMLNTVFVRLFHMTRFYFAAII